MDTESHRFCHPNVQFDTYRNGHANHVAFFYRGNHLNGISNSRDLVRIGLRLFKPLRFLYRVGASFYQC